MAGSFGWDNGSMINIGYNQKSGAGIGVGQAGTTNMYYPKYDYNKPEKAVNEAIYQARKQNVWLKDPLSQLFYYYLKSATHSKKSAKTAYN